MVRSGTPAEVIKYAKTERNWFQILAANISALTALTTGMLFGWTSPSIPALLSDDGGYNFTLEECSYFPVITALTVVFYCVIPGILMDKIGRKKSLIIMTIVQISVCLFYAFSRNIYLFYAARVLTGIGDASLFAILPVYLGEILTPKVRGVWGNVLSLQIYIGQFMVNVIGGYLDVQTTALIILTVPISFLCLFPILPESPYYYAMKGMKEEAKQSLRKLRQSEDVEEECERIDSAVKRQLSSLGSWKDLFVVTCNRKAVVATIFMRIAQQTAGFAALATYTKYIFEKSVGSFTASESAIIFTGTLAVTCILGAYLMDKLGRRFALMYSFTGITLVLTGVSVYFYLEKYYSDTVDLSNVRFLPLLLLLVYVFLWCTGLGIVPNLMLGELFSANIKAKGLCVANMAFGLSVSANTKLFQLLEVNFGLWCPFAFFAVCTFVNLFLSNFIVPETRLKTLEEIQLSLQKNKKANKHDNIS